MPLYRLESYQGGRVLKTRTVELADDEAAERALLADEEEFAAKLKGMGSEELLRTFAGGTVGFRARREPDDGREDRGAYAPEGMRP